MITSGLTLRTVLRWSFSVVLLVVFVGYIIWQSRLLLTGPILTITTPPPATTSSSSITIAGIAENIVWIRLNGRDILTTATGDFKEHVYVENGYTIVQLEAADRYGRRTTQTYPIAATPPATSTATSSNQL